MVNLSDAEFRAAADRGREMMERELCTVSATYGRETGCVIVELPIWKSLSSPIAASTSAQMASHTIEPSAAPDPNCGMCAKIGRIVVREVQQLLRVQPGGTMIRYYTDKHTASSHSDWIGIAFATCLASGG